MNVSDWSAILQEQIEKTSIWEWVAVAAGVAQVLLSRINSIWLYPAGIVSTAIYIYLMLDYKLYAESLLNTYYLIMSIYGWLHWLKRKNEPPLPISVMQKKDYLISLAIIMIGWLLMFWILRSQTDSNVPAWDAWVSATAWAGMWLLARRKLENWLVLNLSNAFAIPLFLYKGLFLTAGLTLFLFIVAIFGYLEWRKRYREQSLAF